MSKTWDGSDGPRAVIHKRILDVARDNPDASLADIADEISGANADLVDRVLSKYGDPGEAELQDNESAMSQNGQQSVESGQSQETETNAESDHVEPLTDPGELTEKQFQTVRTVYEDADATQGDIADRLGVTRATVSRRLNDIPGFEWSDRETFTASLFDDTEYDSETPTDDTEADATTRDESGEMTSRGDAVRAETAFDALEERLTTVEETLDETAGVAERPIRRELAHKVVHAAMESERITEDEELELIDGLLD